MNHEIRYTGLLYTLSTKQKQSVYKIGESSLVNWCSDTMLIVVRLWKYTGIVHSFLVCAVRKFLGRKCKKILLEAIFRGWELPTKFVGFAGNYFCEHMETFFPRINFLDTVSIHFQENFFSRKTNFKQIFEKIIRHKSC